MEKYGFISVSLGNSNPLVIGHDGCLIIGRVDENALWIDREAGKPVTEPNILGRVDTGLWAVTLIGRRHLVELAGTTSGLDEAERAVAARLDEEPPLLAKIAPGPHYLYFSGDYWDFADQFRAEGFTLPSHVEPMFILANRKLTTARPAGEK